MEMIGIIPARYASTRFPGKPLAILKDKPVVQWVYERSRLALREVFVATDDERILKAVQDFGGRAVMTSAAHPSGTDRCLEALEIVITQYGLNPEVVINIQGDEPFIMPEQIRALKNCFSDPGTDIATLVKPVEDPEEIFDENKPKVVINSDHYALYFSRSPIPFLRGFPPEKWFGSHPYLRHIGIYAYRTNILREITRLQPSPLEMAESLEQLRWLFNGYRIKVRETPYGPPGIDTPADLEKARRLI